MGLRTDQLFFCTCPSPGRERVLVLSRRMVLHDLKDSAKICSSFSPLILALGFLKVFIYLFLERGEGREKERERETSMCGCLSRGPHWGPGLQPRHVP